MIHLDVPQGSEEWLRERVARPTASCFDRIITPAKLQPSKSQDRYICDMLAEWIFGSPVVAESVSKMQSFMERGKTMEQEAAAAWAFENDIDTTVCGLCLTDDRKIGASPDRFIGTDRRRHLEVKVPSAWQHLMYLMYPESLDDAYRLQVQGQLWVAETQSAVLISYHPNLDWVVREIDRDEAVIQALQIHVYGFVNRLEREMARFADAKAQYEAEHPKPKGRPADDDGGFCSPYPDGTIPGTQANFDVDEIIERMESQ